jgi:GNAT superfamily N-acetyltransferase
MLRPRAKSFIWETYSRKHLPVILRHQEELYSLNFEEMVFDSLFFANIKNWYTEGILYQGCYSRLLFFGKELVGFYLFQKDQESSYLMQMFVTQPYRGQGYGQTLLLNYEEWATTLGAYSSFLHASSINAKAVAFYQRNGYVVINQENDEQGNLRNFMVKSIP